MIFDYSFESIVDQDKNAFSNIKLICLLNSSAVKLKTRNYKECIDLCDEVYRFNFNFLPS